MALRFLAMVLAIIVFGGPSFAFESNATSAEPALLPEFVPLSSYDQFMLAFMDSNAFAKETHADPRVQLAALSEKPELKNIQVIRQRSVMSEVIQPAQANMQTQTQTQTPSILTTGSIDKSALDQPKAAKASKAAAHKPTAKKRLAHKQGTARQPKTILTEAKQPTTRVSAKKAAQQQSSSSSFGTTFDRLVQSLF